MSVAHQVRSQKRFRAALLGSPILLLAGALAVGSRGVISPFSSSADRGVVVGGGTTTSGATRAYQPSAKAASASVPLLTWSTA